MPLETHDLALSLAALEAKSGVATTSHALPGFEAVVVRIPPGDRYDHGEPHSATLLVLEGTGTVALDDWRATLAGGHLVAVPARAHLVVTADAGVAFALLITRVLAPAAEGGAEG